MTLVLFLALPPLAVAFILDWLLGISLPSSPHNRTTATAAAMLTASKADGIVGGRADGVIIVGSHGSSSAGVRT